MKLGCPALDANTLEHYMQLLYQPVLWA